ncbi:MAG: hypothetical protein M0R03_22795 [Novosphingobium sp.]|nr:hypothetical protein [Novosphingobium sp.]
MYTRADIMKWVQRLHIKSRHAKYINDEIEYEDYKEYINYVLTFLRPSFSENDLDLLWQNLNFTSYSWGVVKEELFAAIAS